MAVPAKPTVTVRNWPVQAYSTVSIEIEAGTLELDLYRDAPSGARSYIRGVVERDVGGLAALDMNDYEAPFGVEVSYVAVARNDDGETPSDPASNTLEVDVDWLTDLNDVRNSGEISIEGISELDYGAPQGVHRILGRRTPVVTSDLRWTPAGRLDLVSLDAVTFFRVRDALASTAIVLLRTPPERGVGNMFLYPTGFKTSRVSRLATRPERRFEIDFVQVARPDPAVVQPTPTFADVIDRFADYAAVLAGRATYGELLYSFEGMTPPEGYSTAPDWPAVDE